MSHITPRLSRAARTLALALCIATPSAADSPPPAPAAAAEMAARIQTQTDLLASQALDAQLSALQKQTDERLARAIATRIDTRLASLTKASSDSMLAKTERPPSTPAEAAQVRIESGSIALRSGVETGRHHFDEPFGQTPKIALGFRMDDESGTRPILRIVRVDPTGFDYEIRTPGGDGTGSLTADWVAFVRDSKPPANLP